MCEVLVSRIDPRSEEFRANHHHHASLAARQREEVVRARDGGGEKERGRHAGRGKLPVRARIERLLDAGGAFLEIGPLAGFGGVFRM